MPEGTSVVLDARCLATAHRRLAELLRPGISVLDVGCGTGAITRGIAEAVGPTGRVIGVDVNPGLIARAQQAHGDVPSLSFEVADLFALPFRDEFDVVTAARVVQWLADPLGAVKALARAARPGGLVLVLDYNHERAVWTPDPPESMRAFYAAFLRWRAEAGMDNSLADHLAAIFASAGLAWVAETVQDEVARRGDPDFEERVGIWAEVAATRGRQMVADGAISEAERARAEADYREWVRTAARSQTLYLRAVEGRRPTEWR
jgi:ubiquinone/menaquinone biosynthesis C-methylase UbiE